MLGRKFGSRGPLMIEKNTSCCRQLDFPFKNLVLVSVTVSAKSIGQFGLPFQYWKNSGFGRTL